MASVRNEIIRAFEKGAHKLGRENYQAFHILHDERTQKMLIEHQTGRSLSVLSDQLLGTITDGDGNEDQER
jgi:hypothetical protein